MNFFFGFSRWKHPLIEPFIPLERGERNIFINSWFGKRHLRKALKKGLKSRSHIYFWGRKSFDDVEAYAKEHENVIYRVEDGFIRSVGLGSDLTQPYSLVIDSRGIYFDPTCESDLEHLLQSYDFDREPQLLSRAASVRCYLVEKKLSKYNLYAEQQLQLPKDRRIILVPGQVEDDASIRFGAPGMTNLELLKQARNNAPDACIVYKPHPDVLVGNRVGHVDEEIALQYCDRVVTEVSLDSVLTHTDEVHTMTSLVGFEALMRGKKVMTYGMPFYSGWGLTTDMQRCERRTRRLTLDQLVAATLLLYPRYIDPETKQPCEIERVLEYLDGERERYNASWSYRTRMQLRNWCSRKGQLLWRMVMK